MPYYYIDDKGLEVFVSSGIGDSFYGAFRRKKTGSLQRIKAIPMLPDRSEAEGLLRKYAATKGWDRMMYNG